MLTAYTDGSFKPHTNTGGIGIVAYNESGKEVGRYSKGYAHTTSNRMEILALITAMKLDGDKDLLIYTDSSYVQRGYSEWLHGWAKKGWRKHGKGKLKNYDLWKQVYELKQDHIQVKWVKGHEKSTGNMIADMLASTVSPPFEVDENFKNGLTQVSEDASSGLFS